MFSKHTDLPGLRVLTMIMTAHANIECRVYASDLVIKIAFMINAMHMFFIKKWMAQKSMEIKEKPNPTLQPNFQNQPQLGFSFFPSNRDAYLIFMLTIFIFKMQMLT